MNNIEIASKLGIVTRIIDDTRRYKGNPYYQIEVFDKEDNVIHMGWYTDSDNYAYIIQHLIEIGKLPNYMNILYAAKDLIEVIPELAEMFMKKDL